MPASVTVEGGRSGPYLDCFSDASLEPPAIAVYNPGVLGVYLVFIIPHMMANRGCLGLVFIREISVYATKSFTPSIGSTV